MGKYFGTDGIRGNANDTLSVERVMNVGRFVGCYFADSGNKRIVIGKDTRLSSSMFEMALACGLSWGGCDVYLLGYCSTPSLAYITMKEQFACGCMISASHNPYHDNGVKIFGNNGIKIADELEGLIEAYIDNPTSLKPKTDDKIGHIYQHHEALKLYKDWLGELYPIKFRGHKFVADLAHGSNCLLAQDVLEKTEADVTYINDDFNGLNINDHCGSTHLEKLQELVKAGDFEFGLAFDGDADRVLFVDELGEVVDGDKLLYILSLYLQAQGLLNDNTLVTTVMSNIGLFKALDKKNIKTVVTPVGDKNVLDAMLKGGFVIGGEQSGHIICTRDSNFGDGLKTALLVLSCLKKSGKSLRELVAELEIFPQLLVNVKVKDKSVVLQDKDILEACDRVSAALAGDGRLLVRPSGTEPLIRVMVEAKDDETCRFYVDKICNLIKEKGYAAA